MDNRNEIRGLLTSRRAGITPEQTKTARATDGA
jgi:hypothetical protein